MPNFVSIEGKWVPRRERVVNPNAAEGQEVYDGDDRAALEMLQENGGSLGKDCRMEPDTMMMAKNLGFSSVDEYLEKMHNYNSEEKKAEFQKLLKQKVKHENPKPKKAVQVVGGGQAIGAETKYGSFAETQGKITATDVA